MIEEEEEEPTTPDWSRPPSPLSPLSPFPADLSMQPHGIGFGIEHF